MNSPGKLFPDFDQQHVVVLPANNQSKTRSPLLYAGGLISSNHKPAQPSMRNSKAISIKSKGYTSLPMFKEEEMLLQRKPDKVVEKSRSVANQAAIAERVKEIMPKLTMKRLRKIQALVRGFLTRRIILPPLLKQHSLCTSIYQTLRKRVSDKLVTQVCLEVITFNKYNEDLPLNNPKMVAFQNLIDSITNRVIQKESREIVTQAVLEMATKDHPIDRTLRDGASWNMKDPCEVLIYGMICKELKHSEREIAQQAIADIVQEIRMEQVFKQHVMGKLIDPLLTEVFLQIVEEHAVTLIVEDIQMKSVKSAAQAIAKYQFEKGMKPIEEKALKQFNEDFKILLVAQNLLELKNQEAFSQPVSQEKLPQNQQAPPSEND